ncbi:TPA: transcriptional regulator [Serratia fonticola]
MFKRYLIDNKIIYDVHNREISKIDDPARKIKLSKIGAQCLQILIDAKHQMVSQENISKDIWGVKGIIVGSNTLYQHIYMLRKSLSDLGADKTMIRTTPRQGMNIPEDFPINLIYKKPKNINSDKHEQASEHDEELSTGINNIPTKNRNSIVFNKFIYYFALSALALIFYIRSDNSTFICDYSYLGQYKNCEIYRYPGDLTSSEISPKIISRGMSCDSSKRQFIYYTENKKSKMESIISCENRLNSNVKSNCKSFHWSGYE